MDIETESLVATDNEAIGITTCGKKLTITRQVYTKEAFDSTYPVAPQASSRIEQIKRSCQCNGNKAKGLFTSYFPVVKALLTYKPKKFLTGDILAGLTVSFMHLPQAMGFGILASLKPVHGLYTTFFSVITYMVFGTSPYISFGTNAVMALLTQTVVEREADAFVKSFSGENMTEPTEEEIMNVKIGAATACCLLVGIILTVMGLLKLGVITTYLSASFIGGFTTAAAIHIASSQVPKALGVRVKAFSGPGKLILMYVDLFKNINETNVAEVVIALVCIIILLFVKIIVNERYKEKLKIPIPIDLIVVIVGTVISHFAKFSQIFDVKVVGPIPSGFQPPVVPSFRSLGNFASNAFVMAILSLAMSISLAKLCANKHGKPIDNNQELVAYGVSNIVSSFFFSFPSASAPPRTMILSSLGARTTLNAIATTVFVLLVILVIGALFVSLPMCVLAAMIIISMKDLLLQYRNLPNIWRINKYDFLIWVVTNCVSVLVDLDYGIIAGVGISIFLTVVRDQISSGSLIGLSKAEDVMLETNIGSKVRETSGIKVFKIPTSLYFATSENIKLQIFKEILDPKSYHKSIKRKIKNIVVSEQIGKTEIKPIEVPVPDRYGAVNIQFNGDNTNDLKTVVLDCTLVSYIDMAGITTLQQVTKEYKDIAVDVYLVRLQDRVYNTLDVAGFFKHFPKTRVFIDLFDVLAVLSNQSDC